MADGCNGLAGNHEVAYKGNGGFVEPPFVWIDRAAGQHQRVVVLDRCVRYQAIDGKCASRFEVVVARLDFAIV
jgi:hypothetical protein